MAHQGPSRRGRRTWGPRKARPVPRPVRDPLLGRPPGDEGSCVHPEAREGTRGHPCRSSLGPAQNGPVPLGVVRLPPVRLRLRRLRERPDPARRRGVHARLPGGRVRVSCRLLLRSDPKRDLVGSPLEERGEGVRRRDRLRAPHRRLLRLALATGLPRARRRRTARACSPAFFSPSCSTSSVSSSPAPAFTGLENALRSALTSAPFWAATPAKKRAL